MSLGLNQVTKTLREVGQLLRIAVAIPGRSSVSSLWSIGLGTPADILTCSCGLEYRPTPGVC